MLLILNTQQQRVLNTETNIANLPPVNSDVIAEVGDMYIYKAR